MKLRSMTGFGSAEASNARISVKAELKSLNGKFMDLNMRLPRNLQNKEIALRRELTKRIERGSATLFVNIERNTESAEANLLNTEMARKLFAEIQQLQQSIGTESGNILDRVLAFPGVINADEVEELEDEDWQLVEATVYKAFDAFDAFRVDEGASLKGELKQMVENIQAALPGVEQYEGERINTLRERIRTQLNNTVGEESVDKDRFEQEMIYYLEKIDFSEEKSRLIQHCKYFTDTLEKEPNGKKLGFISQEMGREINTLGAKAAHFHIQQQVVIMKDELEKIKEQVNNVL
ncbi:MAG TPA: YicC/YloC family endoribonuclease [Bacteroidia bacterium]|nr:YicC/YloC family endoribonuclease [Bacteroidia bacterium]